MLFRARGRVRHRRAVARNRRYSPSRLWRPRRNDSGARLGAIGARFGSRPAQPKVTIEVIQINLIEVETERDGSRGHYCVGSPQSRKMPN